MRLFFLNCEQATFNTHTYVIQISRKITPSHCFKGFLFPCNFVFEERDKSVQLFQTPLSYMAGNVLLFWDARSLITDLSLALGIL